MQVLREGMNGGDVSDLQQLLRDHGFSPGAIDGAFGPGTTAAVLAFQQSEGLLADGVVGPRTAAALGVAADAVPAPAAMPAVTVAIVAKMFPQTPLGNINRNLPAVLDKLARRQLTSIPIVLAALATIRAETAGFEPISEFQSRFNTSPNGHPFDLYDNRQDLGNRGAPDGERFKGRGFVQLTGRNNYQTFSGVLKMGDDLVTNPDLANETDIAADLLAAFIAAKEIPLKQALHDDNLAAARKLVNGGSHGLQQFTDAYRTGQQLLAPGA